jgi:membrane-associated protein
LRPSFEKNALLTIFLSRFLITAIGPMVNILSGLMRIHPRIFVPIDIIGETLYIGLYMYIGYRLGAEWESIITLIESFSTLLLSLF